jgi:hypothetical protein
MIELIVVLAIIAIAARHRGADRLVRREHAAAPP